MKKMFIFALISFGMLFVIAKLDQKGKWFDALAVNANSTISGVPQVGKTLTASGGTGGFQWYHEGFLISGATASTYTLQPGDLSDLIQVASGGVFSATAGPVIGTTVFYVSQSTGNDSNPGTVTQPWKTVAKVNGVSIPAGSSVLFKRGDVWREQIRPHSGTVGSPIVYGAYGTGPNPTFLGSVSAASPSNWTNTSGNIWISNQTFAPAGGKNGLPFNNANDVGNVIWGTFPGHISTGVVPEAAFFGQSDTQIKAQGQWYFNTTDWKVHIFSSSNPALVMPNLELAINKVGYYASGSLSNNVLEEVTLQYYGATAILSNGLMTNVTFRDVNMYYIGGGNLGGNGVRYGDGYNFEGGLSNVLVERNYIQEMYDVGISPQWSGSKTANGLTLRNNIIWGDASSGFTAFGSGVLSNFAMYNNTFVTSPSWSEGQRWGADRSGEDGQYWPVLIPSANFSVSNIAFKNNVFLAPKGLVFIANSLTQWNGALTSDYNNWATEDGSVPLFLATNGGGNVPLTQWASSFPAEQHGLIRVNPAFTDLVNGNFIPASTSPLRGHGVNLYGAGVVWDFNKKTRPSSGPFTIGAIQ